MFTKRRTIAAAIVLLLGGGLTAALSGWGRPVPLKLAPGWSIELIAEAPGIINPTAIVEAPDGTVYLGQDPMDMAGPPTEPADSVVAIKAGRITRFADRLHAVMGLEWIDGTLYVVHAPYLSSFRDTDGDGRADERIDLVCGLGPDVPAFNGINDHIASGLRLGMDGFLYVAVGDKGIPRAIGTDGATIRMRGGGVIRVRPDGTGLEVVSTGERNPLSVALSDTDEIFTYGNDDDSKRWPNSLTHHIVGGHFGYPYEFLAAPDRALPILDGSIGGAVRRVSATTRSAWGRNSAATSSSATGVEAPSSATRSRGPAAPIGSTAASTLSARGRWATSGRSRWPWEIAGAASIWSTGHATASSSPIRSAAACSA